MDRQYLLKVIEKHFFVLSKEEIAEKIKDTRYFKLPDFLVEALQTQDPRLNAVSNLTTVHMIVTKVFEDVSKHIAGQKLDLCFSLDRNELREDVLLLISIYYHYSAFVTDALIADFIQLVLVKKLLLT